jgi:hypothetical protein
VPEVLRSVRDLKNFTGVIIELQFTTEAIQAGPSLEYMIDLNLKFVFVLSKDAKG